MMLTGQAKLAGVMGWPISHSRSPMLHAYWLNEYGIDAAYLPFSVDPASLEVALRALPALGIAGTNLTVPHKEAALEICDHVDEAARHIGAVNTVVVQSDGSLFGSNTDAFGFIENLKAESSWQANNGPAVILGAGGAARAVVSALVAEGVAEIRIANRTFERARALADAFGSACQPLNWSDTSESFRQSALLVNTTTLGMTGQPRLNLPLDTLPITAVVNDIVYAPLETDLLKVAAMRGNPVVDGLGMLLHQARPGFAAWFGREPDVTSGLRKHILAGLIA